MYMWEVGFGLFICVTLHMGMQGFGCLGFGQCTLSVAGSLLFAEKDGLKLAQRHFCEPQPWLGFLWG